MFKAHAATLEMIIKLYGAETYYHINNKLLRRKKGAGFHVSAWPQLVFRTQDRADEFFEVLWSRVAEAAKLPDEMYMNVIDRGLFMFHWNENFSRGPYIMRKRKDDGFKEYLYSIRAGERTGVSGHAFIAGTKEQCERWLDDWSTRYAQHLMVKP